MTPETWQRVKAIFAAVHERPPKERARFLDDACVTDPDVRAEVESLLAAEAGDLLDTGALGAPAQLGAALAERYGIERELGQGGMATVYLAQDRKHHRSVALKVLKPDLASALGPSRFLREIEVTARLNHPHILPLLDSGNASGFVYYAMPYVEGESLRDRLHRERQLPLDDAVQITREVADALSYAHAHGVVHRDIKPENILLESGHALVADFGIARAVTSAGAERLTETGIAVGTPAYMSPEQGAGSGEVDGRSDVYSLGCVLYEMLCGETPYTGPSPQAVLAKKLGEPLPRISVVRETVPADIERALSMALAKVPADRFSTARQFAAALDAGAATAPRPRVLGRRWGRAALAALLPVAGVALWLAVQNSRTTPAAVSPNRIAVFPLTVQAPRGHESLGEAVMDLLGSDLDGVGDLRRVDPVAVIGALQRAKVATADPETGARLARQLGAGRYIVGTIIPIGDQLRVSASVYDVDRPGEPAATSTQQGQGEDLAHVTERLAADVVGHLSLGSSARLERISGVRAANYPALKAYLEAERYLRRGAEDSAKALLLRAVGLDSTFALAWYRLSWAQDFTYDYRQALSADRAYQLRERLSRRDQLLAAVTQAYAHAEGARAESLALAAVGTYPDEVEAWWLLGVLRMWDFWRSGRSPLEGLEPFERALALDPGHRNTLWNATWLRLYARSYASADSLIQQALANGVQAGTVRDPLGRQIGVRAIRTFAEGNQEEQKALLAELGNRDDGAARWAGHYLALFSDSLTGAEAAFRVLLDSTRRSSATRADAGWYIGILQLAGGRWDDAQREFARWATAGAAGDYTMERVLFAAAPFFDLPATQALALRDSLTRWPTATSIEFRIDDSRTWGYPPPELRDHLLRTYLRGLLSALAGDETDARVQAARLERAREPGDSAGLLPDLALEIRALAAVRRSRDAEALATLEKMAMRTTWHYQQHSCWVYLRPLGRFLRGEVLYRLGRYDEALGWYWFALDSYPEIVFQAPSFLRRGEIYEKLGNSSEALREYRRFVARWHDADARYQPLVRDVEARIARLSGGLRD